jgi:hypothetical protein
MEDNKERFRNRELSKTEAEYLLHELEQFLDSTLYKYLQEDLELEIEEFTLLLTDLNLKQVDMARGELSARMKQKTELIEARDYLTTIITNE